MVALVGKSLRKFAVFAVLSASLMQPSDAQPFPESERQKAEEERLKAESMGP